MKHSQPVHNNYCNYGKNHLLICWTGELVAWAGYSCSALAELVSGTAAQNCQKPVQFWVAILQPPVKGLTTHESSKYHANLKIVWAHIFSNFLILFFKRWLEYSLTCLKPLILVNTLSYTQMLYTETTPITLRILFLHLNEAYDSYVFIFFSKNIQKYIIVML